MSDEMGSFRVDVEVENPVMLRSVPVDTGAELSWFPTEGLNLRTDPVSKRLIDAGPAPRRQPRRSPYRRSAKLTGADESDYAV